MVDDIRADQAAYVQIMKALHKIENQTEDGTLLVLKGHLVIEELLRAKLEAALHDPVQLRKANLSFYQVLCIARGVFGDVSDGGHSEPKSLWDVVEAWNALRNRLAHRIEPTDLIPIIGRIAFWVPDWTHDLESQDAQNCLSVVIGMLIASFGKLERPIKNKEKINPTARRMG